MRSTYVLLVGFVTVFTVKAQPVADLTPAAWRNRLQNTPWAELWANDRTLVAVASDRVKKLGVGRYEFWVKWMSTTLEDGSKYRMSDYDSLVHRWQIDCRLARYRSGQATFYRDGKVVRTDYPPKLSQWEEPVPESYADTTLRESCKTDSIIRTAVRSPGRSLRK